MIFLQSVFLYYLPIAAIPLLMALIYRLNRKKIVFPSIELLENLLKSELNRKRFKMRLKQFLRVIILILIILAFSDPVISSKDNSNAEYTVIVDHTASMSRFDIKSIITTLNEDYRIDEIRFNNQVFSTESIKERNLFNDFSYKSENIEEIIFQTVSDNENSNFILITDGQKSNIPNKINELAGINQLLIMLCEDDSRNININEVSVFPQLSVKDLKSEFTIIIDGDIENSDRLSVKIDDEEVLSEIAQNEIDLSRYINESGILFGKCELSGDDFTNDNDYYFSVLSTGRPAIYDGIDSLVITKILNSIFPDYYKTDNIEYADIIIAGNLPEKQIDKPVFLFCEDNNEFENTIRRDFSKFIQFSDNEIAGDIESEYEVLNIVSDFKVTANFKSLDADIIASSGGNPIAYQLDNYTVFNFSLAENEDYFEKSVFLLLMINETVINYYSKKYLLDKEQIEEDDLFYDNNGLLVDAERVLTKPGIYVEKNDGKYYIQNIEDESVFEFYNNNDLKKYFSNPVEFINLNNVTTGQNKFIMRYILLFVYIVLIIIELI